MAMKRKHRFLPYLDLRLHMPCLYIRTSVAYEQFERDEWEYIHINVELFKWKFKFKLYTPYYRKYQIKG